jgi:hypothetical protein
VGRSAEVLVRVGSFLSVLAHNGQTPCLCLCRRGESRSNRPLAGNTHEGEEKSATHQDAAVHQKPLRTACRAHHAIAHAPFTVGVDTPPPHTHTAEPLADLATGGRNAWAQSAAGACFVCVCEFFGRPLCQASRWEIDPMSPPRPHDPHHPLHR